MKKKQKPPSSPQYFKKKKPVNQSVSKPPARVQVTQSNAANQSPTTDHQSLLPLIVFIQAFLATSGSLYYSTFGDPIANLMVGNLFPVNEGFTPCLLCWFSRILMYPLVFISYVALIRKDRYFSDYVLPFSILGMLLSTYHYILQKFPGVLTAFECSATHPCNAMEVDYFGFITIPFLALTAYTVITIASLLNVWINRNEATHE